MKVLVLGSEGFIGSHLVRYFSAGGLTIEGCDLTEHHTPGYRYHKISVLAADYETLFASGDYDVVINAAGSGNVGHSLHYPKSDFDSNTLSVIKILDAIRLHRPACKYLHISSAAVYGNPVKLPVAEAAPLLPLSPYGFHKLMSEQLCEEYAVVYGLPIAILRPFSVFGNGLRKQLFWDLCSKYASGSEVSLFGTGNETRDFIHISDFVRATGTVLTNSSFSRNIYNVASGHATCIQQVADLFAAKMDGKPVHFSGDVKQGDPCHWQADIGAITRLGFEPRADFVSCVNEYIDWFFEQQTPGS